MWEIYEHKKLICTIRKIPKNILERYEIWKDIIQLSGPHALRLIKGFHDETLSGKWEGFRSSRLNIQYRIIYRVYKNELYVMVMEPHG